MQEVITVAVLFHRANRARNHAIKWIRISSKDNKLIYRAGAVQHGCGLNPHSELQEVTSINLNVTYSAIKSAENI